MEWGAQLLGSEIGVIINVASLEMDENSNGITVELSQLKLRTFYLLIYNIVVARFFVDASIK